MSSGDGGGAIGRAVSGEIKVLGSCLVSVDGPHGPMIVELSSIQRRIVTQLAAFAPAAVERSTLIDVIWGGNAPRTAQAALHNQISRIRQRCGTSMIVTSGEGYALVWPTDLQRAVDLLEIAERAAAAGDADRAAEHADGVIGQFRGKPFAEFGAAHDLLDVERRSASLYRAAEIIRLRAAVTTGRLGWASVEAERLVGVYPADEQCWAILAEVHERSGRRGEALGVIDRARRMLRDTLGLDPGQQLNDVLASILGQRDTVPGRAATQTVGRAAELDAIEAAIAAGSFVVVRGESGAGLSTMLNEVVRRSRRCDVRVGVARCVPNPAAPLGDLAEILDDLGVTPGPTFGLLNGFVRAICDLGPTPVLLAVDDLHHAGPSTIAALRSAADSGGAKVIASANSAADWVWRDSDDVIDLAPLSPAAVGEIAATILDRLVTAATARWLARLCGGNPSLLEQLLHDTSVRDAVTTDLDGGASDDAPPGLLSAHETSGLADLVRRRIERLGGRTRLALEIASVCGPMMSTELIERLVPSAEGLAAARAVGLLQQFGTRTSFRHTAVQRVVYSDIAPGRRVEIHHLVGTTLNDSGAAPSLVAHHLLASATLDTTAAIDAAKAAAHQATQQGAHQEAAEWLERAEVCSLAMADDNSRLRVELLIARGDALRLAGAHEHEHLLFEAADLAMARNDPDLLADAAFALLQLGSTTETGRLESRAAQLADLAMAASVDPERRSLVAAAASLTYSMSGHPDRCRKLFLDAEQSATSAKTRQRVLPFAYLALGHPADSAKRALIADELSALGSTSGDPTTIFEAAHLGFSVALQTADGALARSALAEMEGIVETVGDVGRRWALLYCSAALAHMEDRLDDSERLSEAALTMFSPVSASRAFATFGGQLIPIRLAQGRIAELTEVFESLVADQPGVPAWHAALALALATTDSERAALHASRALDDVPADFTWLAGHVIGARAAAIAGDRSTIDRYRERLRPWSKSTCWQGTCTYGPVDTPLALLAEAAGDRQAAEHHRRLALDASRRLGAPVFARELALAESVGVGGG